MLHRGYHRGISELGRALIHPAQVTSGPPLPLEATEISNNWQWFWRLALVNLVGWLVVFALLILLANYMQDATSRFLEQ
jgi:hypothetical protein